MLCPILFKCNSLENCFLLGWWWKWSFLWPWISNEHNHLALQVEHPWKCSYSELYIRQVFEQDGQEHGHVDEKVNVMFAPLPLPVSNKSDGASLAHSTPSSPLFWGLHMKCHKCYALQQLIDVHQSAWKTNTPSVYFSEVMYLATRLNKNMEIKRKNQIELILNMSQILIHTEFHREPQQRKS